MPADDSNLHSSIEASDMDKSSKALILQYINNSERYTTFKSYMLGILGDARFFGDLYPRGNRLVMPALMLSIALICDDLAEEKQPKPSDNNYADIFNNNPKVKVLRR